MKRNEDTEKEGPYIWSLLFMTGYLTQRGKAEGRWMKLAIPNLEIRDIFETQIMEFFKEIEKFLR